MVSLLHRTSTHKVLDIYLETGIQDPVVVTKILNSRGHNRKVDDVKSMLKQLIDMDLIGNELACNLIKTIRTHIENDTDQTPQSVLQILIEHLMANGLMILPFLEAVKNTGQVRSKTRVIEEKTVRYGKKYGNYNLRVGQDISAAMKNFCTYLGLMEKGQRVYQLTEIGKSILGTTKIEFVLNRVKCDLGEPCRETCPANAISWKIINNNCVECSLCTLSCLYGAISINCSSQSMIDTNICATHKNINLQPVEACGSKLINTDELIMQNWIKSVLSISGLSSEIPGVGEYPDIVTNYTAPSFIEVKKHRITEKMVNKIYIQLERYMQTDVINKTLKTLSKSNFHTTLPEQYILIAPTSEYVPDFLSKTQDLNYPTSFLSYESLYALSNAFLNGNRINLIKLWKQMKGEDYSSIIFEHIK